MNPIASQTHLKNERVFDLFPPLGVGWVVALVFHWFRESGVLELTAGKEKSWYRLVKLMTIPNVLGKC